MEAVRTSETSVDNHFTRQYNPEDSSEHQLFNPLTDSNQIWCSDYSEPGDKHRLDKNSYFLKSLPALELEPQDVFTSSLRADKP
jgi:hypothetical protein